MNMRRYNLRICTDTENQRNRRPKRISASGYRGVYESENGKYAVIVRINRKQKYYGSYEDPIEAARARDKIVKDAFGEFAALNFPD